MFTGIVEARVPVSRVEPQGPQGSGSRVWLPRPSTDFQARLGESIAVSGCCLTVSANEPDALVFDVSAETLARTWFSQLKAGELVNLERSLRLSDRLGGHLVSGHVDGGGHIAAIRDVGDGGREITFEVDAGLERYLIEKGSVTLDGVSLTVCEPKGARFSVAVIPATLEITNLGAAEVGQRINVEVDMIGKWIERLVAPHV